MGAISGGGPGYPLRRIVQSHQTPGYRVDLLDCGHEVVDHDNRVVRRRRCQDCVEPTDRWHNLREQFPPPWRVYTNRDRRKTADLDQRMRGGE